MKDANRNSLRVRNTPRQWAFIVAIVLILHAGLLLFFKPRYLEVFKTQAPPGEDTGGRYPFLENPFHVYSLSIEPRSEAHVGGSEPKEISDSGEEAENANALGEPESEMIPIQGGGGGWGAGSTPRNGTVEPKPLYIPWPKYPQGIKQISQGSVELLLLINERGEVADIKVTRELPLSELNEIAVEAARKIRFTPGTERGIRKSMWVRLAIGFQPR
ncbi:MAG: TonB family protein [Candidatus Krumholzibacteria bacterium]|nr:TonB family protein [Candidatus Krumholzibacteria bacterium]